MTFDPTPHLRWLARPVTFGGDKENVPVLQIGYRPINGGEIQWRDVPILRWSCFALPSPVFPRNKTRSRNEHPETQASNRCAQPFAQRLHRPLPEVLRMTAKATGASQ